MHGGVRGRRQKPPPTRSSVNSIFLISFPSICVLFECPNHFYFWIYSNMLPHIFQLIVFSDVNSPTKLLFAYQLSYCLHIKKYSYQTTFISSNKSFLLILKNKSSFPILKFDRNCVITKKMNWELKIFYEYDKRNST